MYDNFERFSTFISVDVMYSSTYDVKELCYIAPVIKKEIDKINVIFEDLVILETYDNYKFIPRSWLKMCPSRKK